MGVQHDSFMIGVSVLHRIWT